MKLSQVLKLKEMMNKAAESLSDSDAIEAPLLFEAWGPGKEYTKNKRIRYGEHLYRVRESHISQATWLPTEAPTLYEAIALPEESGTIDNPIGYTSGMALEKDKYYKENNIIYLCTRDTGAPVYNALADLINIYVEIA